MDPDQFVLLHPQFAQCGPAMIAQALTDAACLVSVETFGNAYSLALRMKACHILALEMYGQQASLTGGETTVYEKKFQALIRALGIKAITT